ncbi:HNH endonuclease [Candidatus Electronema sp. TJ]|uniref:HNH endonuclease n=1 Tax=Candidatus Electronema sp. TJ TaxID=3401573 RepID=UPI003AA7C856
MTVKCKVERILTGVCTAAKDYYEGVCRQYQHEEEDWYIKGVKEEMQMITDSETLPISLRKISGVYRVINQIDPILDIYKYDYLNSQLFLYRDSVYAATGPYTESECMLLVARLADKERTLFEELSKKQDSPEVREAVANRKRISEKVRIAVWRRDQGQCAKCGSRHNLEYDHIIPVAEGGSNTVRNIELLCEKCNRAKGKKIQ